MTEVFKPLAFLLTMATIDLLLMVTLACLATLGWAAWPGRAEATRRVLEDSPGRAMLLGLADVLGSVLVVILLNGMAPGLARLLAICLIGGLITVFLMGLPGLLCLLGQRVLTLLERVPNPVSACGVGAVVLCGGGLLPWVGQLVLILALLGAIGAGVLTVLRPRSGL